MKKAEVKRDTSYPYTKLDVLFNTKLQFIERDAEMLVKYKISQFNVVDLKALALKFKETIMDEQMVVIQKNATVRKEESIAKLFLNLLFLRTAMENSMSLQELKTQIPSIFKITQLSDSELIATANVTHKVALIYQASLLNWGVSVDFLTQFKILSQTCDKDLFETCQSKSKRNDSTEIRRELANKVFSTMKQMCKVGRIIWMMEKSVAKYNDYVLPAAYKRKSIAPANSTAIQS